jgi:ABC-type Fe3+ transport system permease subunit
MLLAAAPAFFLVLASLPTRWRRRWFLLGERWMIEGSTPRPSHSALVVGPIAAGIAAGIGAVLIGIVARDDPSGVKATADEAETALLLVSVLCAVLLAMVLLHNRREPSMAELQRDRDQDIDRRGDRARVVGLVIAGFASALAWMLGVV